MTKFLIHKFIPRDAKQNTKDRQRYGVLSGIVGILCNLLLCVLKFICGTVSHSVSITADAANNLSDASSNIVTVIGAKIASKPVDNDHPFGHGRMEYISALIVDFFIFLMGFELGKSSIEKIIHPQEVRFSAVTVAVLVLSIGVKLWMAYFNQVLYKESNNLNLKAVRQDSLNDCISTAAAGAALLLSAFTAFDRADGIMGLLVAAFIADRLQNRYGSFLRSVIFIPVIISLIASATVWSIMYKTDGGLINQLLGLFGAAPVNFLGGKKTALASVAAVAVWKNTGYYMVIYYAGIMNVSTEVREAAIVDGANAAQRFWYITMPILKPITYMIVTLGIIGSFQVFDLVYKMTGGGPGRSTYTVANMIYTYAFQDKRIGYACALAIVLLVIILVIHAVQTLLFKEKETA